MTPVRALFLRFCAWPSRRSKIPRWIPGLSRDNRWWSPFPGLPKTLGLQASSSTVYIPRKYDPARKHPLLPG